MPKQSPGIFGARFCTTCGQRQRSANHTCQPSAIKKNIRIKAWAALRPASAQVKRK